MLLGLPRTYWIIWIGALVNRLGGFVFTFLALYLTEARHFSALDAGTAVASYGVGSFAAAAFGGWLADRKGRRFGILFGTVTGAASLLVLGAMDTLLLVRIAAFFAGFFGDSYRPALNAAIADVVPQPDRLRAYATLYWAVNVGFAIAASSAGWLAHKGYHWLFIIDAATTLTFATIAFFLVPETKPAAAATDAPAQTTPWWAPFQHPPFLRFVAGQFLVVLAFMQCQVTLPLAMHAAGVASEEYGTLIGINGVLIILVQPLSTRLFRDTPLKSLLVAGSLLTGIGFGLNAFATGAPLFALGIVIWTLGEIAFSASAPAYVAEISPLHARGVYQGAHHMIWGAGFAIAPILGTFVMQTYSTEVLWFGCLAFGVMGALIHGLSHGLSHGLPRR